MEVTTALDTVADMEEVTVADMVPLIQVVISIDHQQTTALDMGRVTVTLRLSAFRLVRAMDTAAILVTAIRVAAVTIRSCPAHQSTTADTITTINPSQAIKTIPGIQATTCLGSRFDM